MLIKECLITGKKINVGDVTTVPLLINKDEEYRYVCFPDLEKELKKIGIKPPKIEPGKICLLNKWVTHIAKTMPIAKAEKCMEFLQKIGIEDPTSLILA